MATKKLSLTLLAAVIAVACGGGSSPSGPDTPPPPPPGSPVTGFVFYDENANGIADPAETVRLPAVGVSVGGVTATTVAGGRFSIGSVPNGTQNAQANPATLPAYFTPGAPLSVAVPPSGEVAIPAVLALGSRTRPNSYLGFGDSITWGEASSDGNGYRDILRDELRSYWGKAGVDMDGIPGTKSDRGEQRVGRSLDDYRPAYLLILYGTNDWNDAECRDEFPCYTVTALRSMVQQARDAGTHPVVGTIPPVNPAYTDLNAAERNDWVRRMNELVRSMARQERAAVAEVHGDFLRQSSLASLFADEKHPNDAGFRVIARSFYDAITRPLPAASASRAPELFFSPPAGP